MMNDLNENGFIHFNFNIPREWQKLLEDKNYVNLDKEITRSLNSNGDLYKFMQSSFPSYFKKSKHGFEHIISLRQGPQDLDDDGIWHDDGSRLLAFSLSLNLCPQHIEGGELLFRAKNNREKVFSIKARKYGTLTVFATGQDGWEHKTCYVKQGTRIIVAGWLT